MSHPATITACILARNEERRIADALRSLQHWTDEIIVIDNESEDGTCDIAQQFTDILLTTPRAANFDAARNLAIERASGDWLFYLDADERVPPALGQELRRLVQEQGDAFEALIIPFKHFFCGKWIEHSGWWPGYTRPQLLKKGAFRYNDRLHSGVEVQGRTRYFPADNSDLAIVHYSYDDLRHYLAKLNNYTDGEAENLDADGAPHTWQAMLAHFVHDWQVYYERGRGDLDGMHGFVLAFLSGFYRFAARAKLWDRRRQRGETLAMESVPASLREMLEFMARASQEGAQAWLAPTSSMEAIRAGRVPLLWNAPLYDASGYADEARNFTLGLLDAGEPLLLSPLEWGEEMAGIDLAVQTRLAQHTVGTDIPSIVRVTQTLPYLHRPAPTALVNVARTMFETDRLPAGWDRVLNQMDRIWVPSQFNHDTFARSGVDPARVAVVPEALDAAAFAADVLPWPVPASEPFIFLSVFDWTLHKGWDALLEAFGREFGEDPEVGLLLKVWSSNHYTLDDIRAQADAHLRECFDQGLEAFPNIHLWQERLPDTDLPRLYRAVQAYVTPTRGEGWCRPLMQSMAAGLPTIATAWSGLTAFHDAHVGYPVQCTIVPVSEAGAREIPAYAGHCWAEPDVADLQRQMRRVVSEPDPARALGKAAQQRIATTYDRACVAAIVQEELAHCRRLAQVKAAQQRADAQAARVSDSPAPPNASSPAGPAASSDGSLPEGPENLEPPPTRLPANPVSTNPIPSVDFAQALGRPLRLHWKGDVSLLSSLAHVNREMGLGLLDAGDVSLTLGETPSPWPILPEETSRYARLLACRQSEPPADVDVTVRHHFPPNWQRPQAGKLVVMQPWEYGHLPREWMAAALYQADEVWAYSRFVRDVYVRSGVPAEKVKVVPLGVRTDVFTPEGAIYALPTDKTTRFLFVGGTIHRKGIDLLLQAYLAAFTAADDVSLVVKSMGAHTFYRDQPFDEAIRRLQADPRAPHILYMEDDMDEATLASLYRACTCVVLPYRGEGFGLPPLEGMACGLPAIVTAGGPTDDYLDDSMALRVPSRLREAPQMAVGPFDCVGNPWQLEPDGRMLIDALRWVRDHPDETRERGRTARAHVAQGWTWERAVDIARQRLQALIGTESANPMPVAVPWPGGESKRTRSKKAAKPIELSLCMIARNEEGRLEECLRSIAPHVDEMVVVDTGSSDCTREIARKCGARVFEMPWPDSFAYARNQSLEQARGQWVFWMDADDVIPPECGRQLRELIRQHPQRDAAYQVQVRIPPGPGEYSASVVDHVKLFPNRPDARFEHRIHEQVLPSLRRAGIDIRFSDLYVTHQNYDRSPEGQAQKRRRDFHLLELDLADRPEHPFVLFNLGMTYLYATREFEVATQYLRRSLQASHWRDSIVRKAYALLTTACICQRDWTGALRGQRGGARILPRRRGTAVSGGTGVPGGRTLRRGARLLGAAGRTGRGTTLPQRGRGAAHVPRLARTGPPVSAARGRASLPAHPGEHRAPAPRLPARAGGPGGVAAGIDGCQRGRRIPS